MKIKNVIQYLLLVSILNGWAQKTTSAFKITQLKNTRVKEAYDDKWEGLQAELKDLHVNPEEFDIYIRVFKQEAQLEVWMKNKGEPKYKLFKTYSVCASSGDLGPKRHEGDEQVPEGFYHIDLFNPKSDYHLSMRINYPNESDVLLKDAPNAGGAIMIHGECVTVGCLPMTNDKIKELYVLCVEAHSRKNPIYVDIFPLRFTEKNMMQLEKKYSKSKVHLWKSLQAGYDYFEEFHWLPMVNIDKKGNYFYNE